MPTTVMMPPPVSEGYAVRCPGTDGRESHVFYITTKPKPGTTYCCPKCYPFMQLDKIAREVSRTLREEESKAQATPLPQIGKTIEELLKDVT